MFARMRMVLRRFGVEVVTGPYHDGRGSRTARIRPPAASAVRLEGARDAAYGRRVRSLLLHSLILLTLAACDAKDPAPAAEEPAPAPTPAAEPPAPAAAKPTPPSSPNEVDLVLEGGLTATLKGKGGLCAKGLGANFEVRSEEFGVTPSFKLNILVTSEDEWQNPSIILNATEPRGNWARDRRTAPAGEKLDLAREHTHAIIDTTLRPVVSGEPVKVRGSIRCPKPS